MEAYTRTNRSESGLPSSPGHNLWNHAHVTNTIHLAPPPVPPMKVPVRPPPLKPVPVSVGNSGGGVPLSPLAMDRLGLPLSLPFSPDLLWRYPLAAMSPAQPPQSPLMDKSQLPGALGPDPRSWAREDVATFLRWCEREFDLPPFDMEKFQMNGKALCLLNKSDITERAPSGGDVIHNALQLLLRDVPYLGRMPNSPLTPHPFTSLTHSHLVQGNHSHGLLSPPGSARTPTSASWPSSTPLFASADLHNLGHIIQQTNSVTLSPAPSGDSSQSTGSPQHGEQASSQGHAHNHGPTMNYSITGNGNHQAGGSAGSTSASGSQSDSEESLQDTSPQRSPVSLNAHIPPLSPGPMQTLKENVTNGREGDTLDSNSNGRLLWDFLQQLLNDPSQRYSLYIAWKNRDTGVFKITDPAGLARLWGIQKNHPSMNYDKMSRALRYYYRVNILRKVQGERHCYQFLRNPVELKSIKNISLLRHQMVSAGSAVSQPAAPKAVDYAADSTPLKVGRYSPNGDYAYEAGYEDCDMPTDLSMESCERRITASLERPNPFSPTVKSENIAMASLDRPNSFLSTVKSEKVAS